MNPIENFRSLVEERLSNHPDNRYYRAGKTELDQISKEFYDRGFISKQTYDDQNLGLMCAKEVEPIDMAFCDAAYAMLEYVRVTAR